MSAHDRWLSEPYDQDDTESSEDQQARDDKDEAEGSSRRERRNQICGRWYDGN